MRQLYKKDLLKIVDIVLSHQVCDHLSQTRFFFPSWLCHWISSSFQGIKNKNKLVLRLMEQLVYPNPAAYRDKLIRFSTLNHTNYSEVRLVAW